MVCVPARSSRRDRAIRVGIGVVPCAWSQLEKRSHSDCLTCNERMGRGWGGGEGGWRGRVETVKGEEGVGGEGVRQRGEGGGAGSLQRDVEVTAASCGLCPTVGGAPVYSTRIP